VKQKSRRKAATSGFDPKRTFAGGPEQRQSGLEAMSIP
jgi:hypothetical protein